MKLSLRTRRLALKRETATTSKPPVVIPRHFSGLVGSFVPFSVPSYLDARLRASFSLCTRSTTTMLWQSHTETRRMRQRWIIQRMTTFLLLIESACNSSKRFSKSLLMKIRRSFKLCSGSPTTTKSMTWSTLVTFPYSP